MGVLLVLACRQWLTGCFTASKSGNISALWMAHLCEEASAGLWAFDRKQESDAGLSHFLLGHCRPFVQFSVSQINRVSALQLLPSCCSCSDKTIHPSGICTLHSSILRGGILKWSGNRETKWLAQWHTECGRNQAVGCHSGSHTSLSHVPQTAEGSWMAEEQGDRKYEELRGRLCRLIGIFAI